MQNCYSQLQRSTAPRQEFASDHGGTEPGREELRPGWVRESRSDTRCRETTDEPPRSGAGRHLGSPNSRLQRRSIGCRCWRAENKIIHSLLGDLMLIGQDTSGKETLRYCLRKADGWAPSPPDALGSWFKTVLDGKQSPSEFEKAAQQNPAQPGSGKG